MNHLQELIETADRLCAGIDQSIANEKFFTDDICLHLEQMSWEIYKMKEDLQQIREYCGVYGY